MSKTAILFTVIFFYASIIVLLGLLPSDFDSGIETGEEDSGLITIIFGNLITNISSLGVTGNILLWTPLTAIIIWAILTSVIPTTPGSD